MTGPLSSLTNRIFLASALLVVISTGVAIYRVSASVTARAEADLQAGLDEAASLVEDLSRTQFGDFVIKGSLIADLPKLMGAAATDDPPTVQPIAEDYQSRVGADLFVVLNGAGRVLARAGRVRPSPEEIAQIFAACQASRDATTFWPYADGVVHAAAIPMVATPVGTLLIGFSLDQPAAARFKTITNSDIVLTVGGRTVASTLLPERTAALPAIRSAGGTFRGWLGPEEYIGRAQPLGAAGTPDEPVAIVLRSRTEHLRFLPPLRWQIALTGLAAVLVATLLGYGIARTVTRPLRAVTATMREIAATGDLGRAVPGVGRWDDEDARLLSTTFGQLTGALHRFQREASQRERLSSLGRLSTVVAHEIRNPLMIIKSAVRTLRRHASEDVAATARSIDEEVNRLNGVVSGVLDFARPIAFDLAVADLVEVGRAAAKAAAASLDGAHVTIDAAVEPAPALIDAERLRAVLINILTNAHQASQATSRPADASPPIRLRIAAGRPGAWLIDVTDRGEGISAEHLGRVFDPFFTTRRTGSGLGLAISRNVIEGLGGTIAIDSRPGAGTRVRIEMPAAAADPAHPPRSARSGRTEVA